LGIAVPIFFSGNISKTKVAQLELQSWEQQSKMKNKKKQFIRQNELTKYQEAIVLTNLEKSYRMKLLKWQIAVINKVKLTSFNTFKV
jgi:cobalt-zinc-cadmium resistance protein CzcA